MIYHVLVYSTSYKLDAIGWYNTSDMCGCLYTCGGIGAVAATVTLATTLSWPEMKNSVACAAMSHFGSSLFLLQTSLDGRKQRY